MMATADVEEKIAVIREALDELRVGEVFEGWIILELDDLLDRLCDLAESLQDQGRSLHKPFKR